MNDRENEAIIGQVEDGKWQTVKVAIYDYHSKPYVSVGIFRIEADGGSFVRGFSLRHELWTGILPLIQQGVELAKVRELAGLEREYADCLPVEKGGRRPR